MKTPVSTFLIGTVTAVMLVSGCGRSSAAQPDVTGNPGTMVSAAPAARAISISADDTMKFNVTEIYARSGETLTVTITNQGAIPKTAMAHNWVLLSSGVDLNAFAMDAVTAAATNYVPASFQSSVIAATALVGPKESQTVSFAAPKTPGRYPFICSFPGHMQAGMKGYLVVE